MSTGWIVFIVVLAISVAILVVLYFVGKKMQKKQAEQEAVMQQNKQSVSMLIIDKKRMKLKEAGLPQSVYDQMPKRMNLAKFPVVKAKIGPQIISLISDEKIFDSIPVKKEVKASISGIYILEVKGLHGKAQTAPAKKKGWYARMVDKLQEKTGSKPVK